MPPKATLKASPRQPPRAPPKPKPKPTPPNRVTANKSPSGLGGIGASALMVGGQLGTAYIASQALSDTLGQLTENPMLLAAAVGVAALMLLR